MSMIERVGAKGALLDEYERAIHELQQVIAEISPEELIFIADKKTTDANCISIQAILTHVISAGFSYANYIRIRQSAPYIQREKALRNSIPEYELDFAALLSYTIDSFDHFTESEVEHAESDKKILTRWGQLYDIEQLLEHAIVHILRHRRQIEKFRQIYRSG